MTRNGKIARLPRYLREQLNHRLDDGEPGPQLLAWLNGCADVQEVLEREFGGRAINEQNLSEWRQGGFKDWQRQQEACDHVRRLTDQAAGLDEAAEQGRITDRLASVFAVELFKLMEQLIEKSTDDKERLGYLREGLREIRLLRRGDHGAARLQMETERWERQMDREDEERHEQRGERSRNRLIDLAFSKFSEGTLAQMFGGGEYGKSMAEMITRIKFDLPLDDLKRHGKSQVPANTVRLDQTESNQIKPDESGSGQTS
jgi:hypothetical protein